MNEETLRNFKSDKDNLMLGNTFREVLKKYSDDDLADIIKNYNDYDFDYTVNGVVFIPSYLAEKNGKFVVDGDRKESIGRYMSKGTLIVNGNAGNWVGEKMTGGMIIVNGNVDDFVGYEISGGKIICLGKVGTVSGNMKCGMIYADKFERIPEESKRFTHNLDDVFKDSKEDEKLRKFIIDYKDTFFRYVNNRKKYEGLAEVLGMSYEEVALEHERLRRWMW